VSAVIYPMPSNLLLQNKLPL